MDEGGRHRGGGPRCTARRCLRALRVAVASLLLLAGAVAEAAGRFDHGLLWQVSRPGVKASHIFGTVHLPDVRLLPLPDPVLEAFAKARSFGLEHYPDEQAGLRFFEGGQFEDGRRLDQIIGDASFRRLEALTARWGFPPEVLLRMKPWAALLAVTTMGEADGVPSVDQELFLRARVRRLPIDALDSVEEQIAVFDGIPEASQVALLRFSIEYHGQLHRVAERTLLAYLRRDLVGLSRAGWPLEAQDPTITRHQGVLEKKVIQDRSVVMAYRMQPQLRRGGAFIAIGAMHLYGEKGIPALLEKEGWRVRRVY